MAGSLDTNDQNASFPFLTANKFTFFSAHLVRQPKQSLGVAVSNKIIGQYTSVVISKVNPGSVLTGKVEPGDCLLAINGTPVRDKREVARLVIEASPNLHFLCARRRVEGQDAAPAQLVPPPPPPQQPEGFLEVVLEKIPGRQLGFFIISKDGLVIVSKVVPGSPASSQLQQYDRIVTINGEQAVDDQACRNFIRELDSMKMLIERPVNEQQMIEHRGIVAMYEAEKGGQFQQQASPAPPPPPPRQQQQQQQDQGFVSQITKQAKEVCKSLSGILRGPHAHSAKKGNIKIAEKEAEVVEVSISDSIDPNKVLRKVPKRN